MAVIPLTPLDGTIRKGLYINCSKYRNLSGVSVCLDRLLCLPVAHAGSWMLRTQPKSLPQGGSILKKLAIVVSVVCVAMVSCGVMLAALATLGESVNSSSSGLGSIPTTGFRSIDESVKDNVGMTAPRPDDLEIRRACNFLRNANWDYMRMGMKSNVDGRSIMIAAAITGYASGDRLVDYCNSR